MWSTRRKFAASSHTFLWSTVRFYKLTEENPVLFRVPYHKAQVTTESTALLLSQYSVRIWSLYPPPFRVLTLQHLISSHHFPLLFNKPQRKTEITGTEASSNIKPAAASLRKQQKNHRKCHIFTIQTGISHPGQPQNTPSKQGNIHKVITASGSHCCSPTANLPASTDNPKNCTHL